MYSEVPPQATASLELCKEWGCAAGSLSGEPWAQIAPNTMSYMSIWLLALDQLTAR